MKEGERRKKKVGRVRVVCFTFRDSSWLFPENGLFDDVCMQVEKYDLELG